MKICFICSEYPLTPHGGIGSFTQQFGRALVQAGHEVRVVGIYPPDCTQPERENDQGLDVWRLKHPTARLSWIPARAYLYRTLARWSQLREIDLVEVPDWQGWAAGWPKLSVPVIVRLHGSSTYMSAEVGRKIDRLTFWLERHSLRRADFWCAVSRYVADKTQQLLSPSRPRNAILYNAVLSPIDPTPPPREQNQVVFAGTLTPRKGVIPLIHAWRKVLQKCPEAELHLYGKDAQTVDGGSMQVYLTGLLDPQTRQRVVFHGHVAQADLQPIFQRATVTVAPSYAEAFALVPLEAMACGSPVIFTQRGAGPELIRHGVNGWLIDPNNIDEIADAIVTVLQDPESASRVGKTGQELVRKHFNLAASISRNEDFYRECITKFV